MCVIGLRTEQLGFIPANVFCMVVSAINLRAWRRPVILLRPIVLFKRALTER